MNKLILLTSVAVFSFGMLSESRAECANNQTCGDDCCWSIDNGTLNITGSGKMDGYEVSTDQPWNSQKDSITAINVSGVDNIGYRAFQDLDKVNNVILSDSVKEIEHRAFRGNTSLTSIDLNKAEIIGLNAFSGANLSSVSMPNVTSIGEEAFKGNKLTSVDIPEGVTSIGDYAFMGNQLTSVNIPEGVTSIGYASFEKNQLTSVNIPEGVTSIGNRAFYNNKLTSVDIPEGVTSIGNRAFYGNNLTSVDIPEGVTSIGEDAFCNNKLTSVNIPEGVTSIGDGAFYAQKGIIDENGKWVSPLTSVTLPSTLTEIGDYAFQSHGLSELIIPEGVTTIGMYAFSGLADSSVCYGRNYDCHSDTLKTIYIPESVTNIGESAFYSNRALTDIILDDNVDTSGWSQQTFSYMPTGLTINCIGDVTKCETALERFRSPNCEGTNACLVNAKIAPISENKCNSLANYYFNGSTCNKRPTDGEEITCDHEISGYVKVGDYCVSPENSYAKKHYTPAEANQWLHDGNDNFVVLTFKK